MGLKNALASAQNRFRGTSWAQKMLWRPHRIAFGVPLGLKKCFGVRTRSLSGHLVGSKNALASAQNRFRDTSWVQKMLWRPHRIAFARLGNLGRPGEAWGSLGRPGEAW